MKPNQRKYQIYQLGKHDILGLIQLSESVGWDYDEQEITTIMSAGTIYGHKNEDGRIISSAAIISYDMKLASIGMVIVHENYRGLGLGRELTEACIHSVSNDVALMLIATKEGQPLYEKLGFHKTTYVHKFLCDNYIPFNLETEGMQYDILPLTDNLFEQVRELDRNSVGSDRGIFLKSRIKQAKQALVVTDKKGSLKGFGLSIDGPTNLILGPIVATDDYVASRILHHLASDHKGKLRIDVPDGQDKFLQYLEVSGFKKVAQPPIMIKNSSQLPNRNHTLFGIAAQIFG